MHFQIKFSTRKYFNSPQADSKSGTQQFIYSGNWQLYLCPFACGASVPVQEAISIFEAEIFMEKLNWQNKHITPNVPQHKYGICVLALSVGAAGILPELHKQLPVEAKHDQEPKQAAIEGSTEEHQKVRKSEAAL